MNGPRYRRQNTRSQRSLWFLQMQPCICPGPCRFCSHLPWGHLHCLIIHLYWGMHLKPLKEGPGVHSTQKPYLAGSLHQTEPAQQLAQPNIATASISPLPRAKVMSCCALWVGCFSRSPPHNRSRNCMSLQGAEMFLEEGVGSWRVETITVWRMRFHSTLEMEISP